MADAQVLLAEDGVFKWDGSKRKQTLIGARLGNLVLTDGSLLFFSSGSNDITVGKVLASGATRGLSSLRTSSTAGLDTDSRALEADGGLSVATSRLVRAELKGMFKYLVVWYRDADGTECAATFSPKNSGMPNGPTWVATINDLASRAGPVASPGAQAATPMEQTAQPAEVPPIMAAPAEWLADPTGRHELRYWDGGSWTEHVSDAGIQGADPIG